MKLTLKGSVLQIDPLMLLFPCVAALLGEGRTAAMLMLALGAHEAAHLLMSRAVHVAIRSIRLTPFGGMAQMENPYAVPAPRLIAVAAAGPTANLLLLLLTAALCHWTLLPLQAAMEFIQINATLMLFNLLPAMPLDGGRMLWALLSVRMSRERALRIAILLGRVLAGLLAALALWGFFARGRLNLSFLFAAAFILASSKDDLEALANSRVQALLNGVRPLAHPMPAELIAIDDVSSPQEALCAARADRVPLFAVYQNGRLKQIIDAQALLDRLETP